MTTEVRILGTNVEWVEESRALMNADRHERLYLVLSYLPSRLFPRSAIDRFFRSATSIYSGATATAVIAADDAASNPPTTLVVEADALRGVLMEGVVHSQERSFRMTPGEIVALLTSLSSLLSNDHDYELLVVGEVLPFIFVLRGDSFALDVKENYHYQEVNGIAVDHAPAASAALRAEIERLRRSPNTLGDRRKLLGLIEEARTHWSGQGPLLLTGLPYMQRSGRLGAAPTSAARTPWGQVE